MEPVSLPSADRQLTHPRLLRLYAYWKGLHRHGETSVPRRDLIDPGGIAPLLPSDFIVAAEGNPPRFRYRLVGSEIVAFTGAT